METPANGTGVGVGVGVGTGVAVGTGVGTGVTFADELLPQPTQKVSNKDEDIKARLRKPGEEMLNITYS